MRISKKLLIVILLACVMLLFMPRQGVEASGLVAIKNSSGGNLTYRGQSEVVYRLEEYNYPTNQLRAVWVSPFVGDISRYQSETQFKKEIDTLLDDLVSMGMNAIVYHVRTHNNAMYKSELNPLASWWSGVNFDVFDPLAYAIEASHKRGIEFHAWMNPYRVSTNGTTSHYLAENAPAINPVHNSENLIQSGNSIIFDPGIPEVRDFLVDTCMELIEGYDIDAIHFDDYFYIEGADDEATRNKYNTENLSKEDFRRKQVDLFIEDLSNNIRKYNTENNKCIQLGISPSNVYQNNGYSSKPTYDANGNLTSPLGSNTAGFAHYDDYLYSDTLNWINHEWIDYIMPQCYHALENPSAPFADVVRWWSWAVKYKKVNFYAGLGIYMANDSSSYPTWQNHINEIELQLLYAGQFSEFGGANFYKYSSLKTSSAVVVDAVDTIKNDFWKVRIPSAINKYYAPIMEEVNPTNVRFVDNTITFDAVDNVRGYMIYQVPRGTSLDKTNIKHVYKYTTETSIKITDSVNYDYYVSSVNLANETSEGVFVNIGLKAEDVINAIDNLPDTVTINDSEVVKQVRNLFNALTKEEQAKVNNLSKLVALETSLNSFTEVAKKLDNYLATLDLHIKENRIIPLLDNMTIAYKNSSDSSLYNLTTGEKYINRLATTLIPVIITYTEQGITVSREININIGFTPTNMTALFYRNDPTSMNEDDLGQYTTTDKNYIGWSGHTLVVDTNVLYIAKNNYIEITDPSKINSCKWTSVAGVYVNKTSSNVKITLSQTFEKASCNKDGVFIINDDKIKTISSGFDVDSSFTIAPNEILVIIRYLDSMINGSPMAPVTNLSVGTMAYIDNETPKSNSELAQVVIDLINTIPANITLDDEFLINEINNQYLVLDDEVKTLVTNYQTLQNALSKIETLKQELVSTKENAISELNQYLDLDNYSETGKTSINTYLENAKNQITNATSSDNINKIVNETKLLLDNVLTKDEELVKHKEERIKELETLVSQNIYSEENQSMVNKLLNNAKTSINASTTIEDINTIVTNAKDDIDYVETLSEERQKYIKKMEEYIASKDVLETIREELNKYKDNYVEQFNVATSDLAYVYSRFKESVDDFPEELAKAKENAIKKINNFVSSLTYSQKELDHINTLKEQELTDLYLKANIAEINSRPDIFIQSIDILHEKLLEHKKTTISKLPELVLVHYTDKQKQEIQKLIDKSTEEINLAGTIVEVDSLHTGLQASITNYIAELANAINKANEYLDSKNDSVHSQISSLVLKYKREVIKAGTIEEVNTIKNNFDQEYNELVIDIELKESKLQAESELRNYFENLAYEDVEMTVIQNMLSTTSTNIDNATTIEEITNLKNKFKQDVENYHTTLNKAKNDAKTTILALTPENDNAQVLIDVTINNINKASSVDEVTEIMEKFINKYNGLDQKQMSCKCTSSTIILGSIISMLGIVLLILKKQK